MGEVSFHVHKLRVKGHALRALVESTNQLLESGREYSKSNCTYFIIQLCLPFKCQFIGACKDPLMVIVTELSPGVSLRKYLISLRPKILDLYMAINFALDIARAKDCLHANGIIHGDLKPETGTYRWVARCIRGMWFYCSLISSIMYIGNI